MQNGGKKKESKTVVNKKNIYCRITMKKEKVFRKEKMNDKKNEREKTEMNERKKRKKMNERKVKRKEQS